MRVYIIHINHSKSIEYAKKALRSFDGFSGWEPELYLGLTPNDIHKYEHIKIKPRSRAEGFFKQKSKMYEVKKACSMNHYTLFKKCVHLNEPIGIIEHDAHCISDFNDIKFDELLIMNIESAIKQKALSYDQNIKNTKLINGIYDHPVKHLKYRFDHDLINARIMPGTAAYAITPIGAKKMIDVYENIGWDQSDFILNTDYVNIKVVCPELFTFKLPNLRMSHT